MQMISVLRSKDLYTSLTELSEATRVLGRDRSPWKEEETHSIMPALGIASLFLSGPVSHLP